MVLEGYLRRLFFQKIAVVFALAFFVVFFIEITHLMAVCKGECGGQTVWTGLVNSIKLADDSLFFVTVVAVIWFASSLVKTSQMPIIQIYTKKPMMIIKSAFIGLVYFLIIYFVIFDFFGVRLLNGSQSQITKRVNTPQIWIADFLNNKIFNLENVTALSGNVNIKSLEIYNLSGGGLQKERHKNVAVSQTRNVHKISFAKIKEQLFLRGTNPRTMLVENVRNSGGVLTKELTLSMLHVLQKYGSLFVGIALCLVFLLSVKSSRGGQINIAILQCVVASIFVFTITEVFKIIDVYSRITQFSSLLFLLALKAYFLFLFTKKHA